MRRKRVGKQSERERVILQAETVTFRTNKKNTSLQCHHHHFHITPHWLSFHSDPIFPSENSSKSNRNGTNYILYRCSSSPSPSCFPYPMLLHYYYDYYYYDHPSRLTFLYDSSPNMLQPSDEPAEEPVRLGLNPYSISTRVFFSSLSVHLEIQRNEMNVLNPYA